jgi:hypothetical protein
MLTNFEPGTYLAFKLSDKCRSHILSLFSPCFSKVICNHITIEFNLNKEKFEQYKKALTSDLILRAYGYAKGDGIECVAVAVGDSVDRADGSFYHITLSLDHPRKPVDSNTLKDKVVGIRSLFRTLDTIKLEGEFKLLKK